MYQPFFETLKTDIHLLAINFRSCFQCFLFSFCFQVCHHHFFIFFLCSSWRIFDSLIYFSLPTKCSAVNTNFVQNFMDKLLFYFLWLFFLPLLVCTPPSLCFDIYFYCENERRTYDVHYHDNFDQRPKLSFHKLRT